jgi:hypothetical protein
VRSQKRKIILRGGKRKLNKTLDSGYDELKVKWYVA